MNPSSANSVLPVLILALATSLPSALKATSAQDQEQFAPDSSTLRVWQNSGRIADLKDVIFDYDTHESASDQAILEANALWLKDHPSVRIRLAGYTDPSGDIVYNLALSQRRAETIKQELIRLGVAENRIVFATGWGELYPNCLESTEECLRQNRRVEFVQAGD